eukprot:1146117-Prymnesium_polylepis.1
MRRAKRPGGASTLDGWLVKRPRLGTDTGPGVEEQRVGGAPPERAVGEQGVAATVASACPPPEHAHQVAQGVVVGADQQQQQQIQQAQQAQQAPLLAVAMLREAVVGVSRHPGVLTVDMCTTTRADGSTTVAATVKALESSSDPSSHTPSGSATTTAFEATSKARVTGAKRARGEGDGVEEDHCGDGNGSMGEDDDALPVPKRVMHNFGGLWEDDEDENAPPHVRRFGLEVKHAKTCYTSRSGRPTGQKVLDAKWRGYAKSLSK